MIKQLILIAVLITSMASATRTDDPNTLKITLVDYAGVIHTMMAWQNNETGIWTVGYADTVIDSAKFFVGNETGYVMIT